MHLFRLNDTETHECHVNPPCFSNDIRLMIVGILGSSISIISLFENLILFYVFATSRKLRRQNYANPVLLAFFDAVVSLGYFFTVSTHFFAFRFDSVWLALLWAKNVRIAYCIQHFALTVSNFLLVVASVERYLANGPHHSQKRVLVCMVRYKPLVIVLILLLALLFKATILLENKVLVLSYCPTIISYVPIWKASSSARQTRFWLRKIFTIIVPFFVLAYCNFYIVAHLRNRRRFFKSNCMVVDGSSVMTPSPYINTSPTAPKIGDVGFGTAENGCDTLLSHKYKSASSNPVVTEPYNKSPNRWRVGGLQPKRPSSSSATDGDAGKWNNTMTTVSETSQRSPRCSPYRYTRQTSSNSQKSDKRGVRIATRTLVMVVGCYLISNSMTTIINIWEDLNQDFLRYRHFELYFVTSDVAALLTICGCALRLPIYIANDRRIRNAIIRAFLRCRYCYRRTGLKTLAANANFDCEKWSIIIVSNSLKSNITGFLSQMDLTAFKEKKSFDQLAILVQNRRRFLVQMTINLGTVEELTEEKESARVYENDEPTYVTDLHDAVGRTLSPIMSSGCAECYDDNEYSEDDNDLPHGSNSNRVRSATAATSPATNRRDNQWLLENYKRKSGVTTERKHSTVIVRKRS